jgi:hypothetical protein
MNVYQKLNDARAEFHSLKLEKTGHNKFAGYKYFELADFLIPALAVFRKHGLCGTVSFEEKEAMMCIRNVEKPDEFIVISSPMGSAALKGCHEVQNVGAVETYQRRYLWVAALEIVEHDALDSSEPLKDQPEKDMRANPSKLVAESVADSISAERKDDLTEDALKIVTAFKALRTDTVMQVYDSITDNDEKAFLWHLLAKDSKARAFIKAQAEERRKQAVAA